MAKTRKQKEEILDKLSTVFQESASTVFVHFKGIGVVNETKMRHALENDGVHYFVAKKTLMRKASENTDIDGDMPELEGEVAIAYGADDPTAPARLVYEFSKQFGEDSLSIIGGIYENKFMDKSSMREIATIPPIDVLRGMFANVINSPIQRFAVALKAVADKKA